MDPKTERKLQKTITKLNITPEDLKEFLKASEAEDEEVNKLVEEANAEKEEPEKDSADASQANQEKEEPAKETKQEEKAPETDPEKEKEAEPEPKPDEPKAEGEGEKKENAPAPDAEAESNEYKKAIEGVNAKIDGLVDALTKAGILTQEKPQVGVDGENLPANDVGKGTQSALDAINKGRRY